MPHHKSEDRGFVPDLLGGGGCYRDRLRVHGLAPHRASRETYRRKDRPSRFG
jgi:hypothetical protein